MARQRGIPIGLWLIAGVLALAVVSIALQLYSSSQEVQRTTGAVSIQAVFEDGKACQGLGCLLASGEHQTALAKETDWRGRVTYRLPVGEENLNLTFDDGGRFSQVKADVVQLDKLGPEGWQVKVTVTR